MEHHLSVLSTPYESFLSYYNNDNDNYYTTGQDHLIMIHGPIPRHSYLHALWPSQGG